VEGLVYTANTGEAAAELGCSAAADLRACTSSDGELVPA
jgi:hypothetical protein